MILNTYVHIYLINSLKFLIFFFQVVNSSGDKRLHKRVENSPFNYETLEKRGVGLKRVRKLTSRNLSFRKVFSLFEFLSHTYVISTLRQLYNLCAMYLIYFVTTSHATSLIAYQFDFPILVKKNMAEGSAICCPFLSPFSHVSFKLDKHCCCNFRLLSVCINLLFTLFNYEFYNVTHSVMMYIHMY